MLDWQDLMVAFALYLILEGILPFANPGAFRQFVLGLSGMRDSSLRYVGLASMGCGVVLLYLVR